MSAVTVNGKRETLAVSTLAELLAGRGISLDTKGVAIARNGAVVVRSAWSETRLDDGDAVEIVRPVQGG